MQLNFPKEGKQFTVLSWGAGQDSTAILLKCLLDEDFKREYVKGQLIVIIADTRNEHPKTMIAVKYYKKLCKKYKVPFFHTSPEKYATGSWKKGLVEFYKAKNTIGSKAFPKTCTWNLKIGPIYKFLEYYVHTTYNTKNYGQKKAIWEYYHKYGKIDVLLGIAKGEEKRASPNGDTGMKWFDECINKRYPLIDIEYDRQACQNFIKDTGHYCPPPSNCILCPFLSKQELLYMYRFDRKNYELFVKLEANKIKANKHVKRNLGVFGTEETLPEILNKSIFEYGHMTREELEDYKFSHGHCVMSKY